MDLTDSSGDTCPFCGEIHAPESIVKGEPGSWIESIPFRSCPNIPPDHVYVDDEPQSGPRGRLYNLRELEQRRHR